MSCSEEVSPSNEGWTATETCQPLQDAINSCEESKRPEVLVSSSAVGMSHFYTCKDSCSLHVGTFSFIENSFGHMQDTTAPVNQTFSRRAAMRAMTTWRTCVRRGSRKLARQPWIGLSSSEQACSPLCWLLIWRQVEVIKQKQAAHDASTPAQGLFWQKRAERLGRCCPSSTCLLAVPWAVGSSGAPGFIGALHPCPICTAFAWPQIAVYKVIR